MPAVVLQDDSGQHLGFLLVAGDEPLQTGQPTRDCVLTGPPKRSEDFEHPLVDIIYGELHKERSLSVQLGNASCELALSLAPDSILTLSVPDVGQGTWLLSLGSGSVQGICSHAGKGA